MQLAIRSQINCSVLKQTWCGELFPDITEHVCKSITFDMKAIFCKHFNLLESCNFMIITLPGGGGLMPGGGGRVMFMTAGEVPGSKLK